MACSAIFLLLMTQDQLFDAGQLGNVKVVNLGGAQSQIIAGPAPVPEPATLLLFSTGLISLAGFGRKKMMK